MVFKRSSSRCRMFSSSGNELRRVHVKQFLLLLLASVHVGHMYMYSSLEPRSVSVDSAADMLVSAGRKFCPGCRWRWKLSGFHQRQACTLPQPCFAPSAISEAAHSCIVSASWRPACTGVPLSPSPRAVALPLLSLCLPLLCPCPFRPVGAYRFQSLQCVNGGT
jgi:hypothetical protein